MRILYAEDDLDLRETTASILRDLRFNVEECDNGKVAFEAYQQNPFAYDIVITDLNMPFMNGIELLKKLARTGIEAEFSGMKLELLEHARKKTTQKVNLFEKVQIPGYKDAIRKVKRFMEDEESLSKSSQKIMRANQEKRKAKEEKEEAEV